MYTLYNGKACGGAAVEAALKHAGAAHEVILLDVRGDEHLTPEFLAINPRGQVPALRLPGGSVMTESAAMLLHLADAFPESGLTPPAGSPEAAQSLRWILFMAVNVYEADLRYYYAHRFTTDADGAAGVKAAAGAALQDGFELFEAALGPGPFFWGPKPSALDYYVWMLARWYDAPEKLKSSCPKTCALAEAVAALPHVAPIEAAHFADG